MPAIVHPVLMPTGYVPWFLPLPALGAEGLRVPLRRGGSISAQFSATIDGDPFFLDGAGVHLHFLVNESHKPLYSIENGLNLELNS
jgi:hypothetical protein